MPTPHPARRAAFMCLLGALLTAVTGHAAPPPNILLISVDDMGYGDAGCYGDTNLIPTPNIDRLATEGVRFTAGYVTAPVCGPSRYGMLTGAYQQRFGVQANSDAYAVLPSRPETLDNHRIPTSQPLMYQALSSAGYHTAVLGKYNLPCYPQTHADESLSIIHFHCDYFPDATGNYPGVDEEKAKSDFKDIYWGPLRDGEEYLTDRLGRQACGFIERNAQRPFFAYLAFNAPHSPMQAKRSDQPVVQHLKTEATRLYGAMLHSVDENVGRVLDTLDRLGLAENTLVAFVSDNGPTFAYRKLWPEDWPRELLGSAGPLRGHKGQYYEGGIRVPFLLRWPARLPAGAVHDAPVSTLDLYPTFVAAAGSRPAGGAVVDGVNLLPALTDAPAGDADRTPERSLYWFAAGAGAVRHGDWKLHVAGATQSLYNLRNDPAETTDLKDVHPAIHAELVAQLHDFTAPLPPRLNPLKPKPAP